MRLPPMPMDRGSLEIGPVTSIGLLRYFMDAFEALERKSAVSLIE